MRFRIGDYVFGVVVARFRAGAVLDTVVQLWTLELVSVSGCETLNVLISRAREQKIDLEYLEKRGSDQVHTWEVLD